MEILPLSGVRVADLSMVWAGPFCTQILASLGAEVIKVESVKRFDAVRGATHPREGTSGYPDDDPGADPWNRTVRFNERNRNKLGITLDLAEPAGIEVFKQLIAVSDVVIENYSARVMEKLGLAYQELASLRPDLIMLSMPGFGKTGPDSGSVAFGITIEAMAGLASLTGYGDGWPVKGGVNTGDPIAGLHAASAILAALYYRAETGFGQFIDLSQQESAICLIGEAVLDFAMNGRAPDPMANRDRTKVPQGCYPCTGEDRWIALSVHSEQMWQALCVVIGRPELAHDSRFADSVSRWKQHDELDRIICTWTEQQDPYRALRHLQHAGIPAGIAFANSDVFSDPHVLARQALSLIDHPSTGARTYPASALRLSTMGPASQRPAPRLGEHNNELLGELLGLPKEQLIALEQQEIIGAVPLVEW